MKTRFFTSHSATLVLTFTAAFTFFNAPKPVPAQSATEWLESKAIPDSQIISKDTSPAVKWVDGSQLTVEGQGFDDTATTYSRLPDRYRGKVTKAVWGLSRDSAGVTLRFVTNSPAIYARWGAPRPAMNHMAHSGSNGLDLYVKDGNHWEFAASGIPQTSGPTEARILPRKYANTEPDLNKTVTPHEYLLFLPTYSETKEISLGVTPGSDISPAPDSYKGKNPIVFYGTSISQGGCAPRSGLGHIERLRRALDYPTINLGFSGSGKCEPEMADVLADIPAALYVIETVPNMDAAMVKERGLPFIKKLRSKAPDTPILMVESPNVPLNTDRNADWKAVYDEAVKDGIANIHYLKGDDLYGGVDSPTVDGVHPTDLGFYQMALHYEPKLREILKLTPGAARTLK